MVVVAGVLVHHCHVERGQAGVELQHLYAREGGNMYKDHVIIS